MKDKRIELFVDDGGWMARFVGDPEVVALFGTDTIPTPFLEGYDPALILDSIERMNPDCAVSIVGGAR